MRKLVPAAVLAAGVLMVAPVAPAVAFGPVQTGVAGAAATVNDMIQVKHWKHGRPHGWSRGRKVGWRGGSVPPGHRR